MSAASKSVGKVSKPGKRFHTKRSLHHGNPAEIRKHNARVGAVIHAYNSAHSWVYLSLMHAARNDSHQAIKEIWFGFMSDNAQRAFALKYFRNNNQIKPPIRRALVWAITELDGLATLRNDAAHTDMIWHYDSLTPGVLPKEATRKRLDTQPFSENWRFLKGDFSALSNYIMDLAYDILFRNTWPSAKRPQLRHSGYQSATTQERKRQAKKKASRPPPQP